MIARRDWMPALDTEMKKTASLQCIACRHQFKLIGYHIADDGMVTPKVYCPMCKASNGEVRLDGWPFDIDLEH